MHVSIYREGVGDSVGIGRVWDASLSYGGLYEGGFLKLGTEGSSPGRYLQGTTMVFQTVIIAGYVWMESS